MNCPATECPQHFRKREPSPRVAQPSRYAKAEFILAPADLRRAFFVRPIPGAAGRWQRRLFPAAMHRAEFSVLRAMVQRLFWRSVAITRNRLAQITWPSIPKMRVRPGNFLHSSLEAIAQQWRHLIMGTTQRSARTERT